jgi:hypothetical protein
MVNESTFVKEYGTWLKKYMVKRLFKKSNLSPNMKFITKNGNEYMLDGDFGT